MMAFLAIAGNAVWGQTEEISISIKGIENNGFTDVTDEEKGYTTKHGDYDSEGNTVKITKLGTFKITDDGNGGGTNSNAQITVAENLGDVTIILDNVRIDASLGNELETNTEAGKAAVKANRCALEVNSGTTVTLKWNNACKLASGGDRAGINVKDGAKLIIEGSDTYELEVGSWNNSSNGAITYGAGIGGDKNDPDFGTIIIESGKINAYSQAQGSDGKAYGAGIGGGYNPTNSTASSEGTIIIKGGDITAKCNTQDYAGAYEEYGAGIGGGYNGTCSQIVIIGGANESSTLSVKPQSNKGADIGVGNGTSIKNPEIIIGKWNKNSNVSITQVAGDTEELQITGGNYVDGYKNYSASGTVTMPDGLQIYVENLTINTNATFKAYNVDFETASLGEDVSHQPTGLNTEIKNYYYGANRSFSVKDLTCDNSDHLFLGWLKQDTETSSPTVKYENSAASFQMPTSAPTTSTNYKYKGVWVQSKYAVTVASGTEWTTAEGKDNNPPKIAYSPEGALDKLTFANPSATDLGTFSFEKNVLTGTPTLKEGDSYEKVSLNVEALLANGKKGTVTIDITCVEEIIIDKVTVATKDHIYNGDIHNGTYTDGTINDDYVLDVEMHSYDDKEDIETTEDLREGVHYRIYQYTVEGVQSTVEADQKTLPIINAGEYNNLVIEAIDATFASALNAEDNKRLKIDDPITVAQRPMNISISLNKQSIEEDEELTWDDVTVTPHALEGNSNSGIVAKDAEDFKKAVTGKITYTLNEEGTIATVKIYDVAVADQGEFLVSNYDLTINGDSYTEGMEVDLDDPEIPVASSSTGGNFNDKRYQLFLANKDYLKTDEKTVEYYEDLKLELFSRHNKKYTDAGGSFTIWYEKDGEANVGGYRLFWSKSGEHGDYQEVKFDPVSEYFRIDNVHSDVYVKIYDADGFPVANEAITAQDFRAYAQANKIIVITPEPTDVQIISMAGAVVAADKVTGQREFANLAEGVYIVRMGETIVKLQVRN